MKREGIHVVGVEVQNMHRLRCAEVVLKPGGGLVTVTGANASGKTSLLRAIAGAIGGAGEVHEEALREGAESGRVHLQLSNGYTIDRHFTERNPKGALKVRGADGGAHKQGTLSGWLGDTSFDPLAFFTLKPDRMTEILLGLSTDPELASTLRGLRGDLETLADERRPHNSEVQRCQRMRAPEGERPEGVDLDAELARVEGLETDVEQWKALGDAIVSANGDIATITEHLTAHRTSVDELEKKLLDARGLVERTGVHLEAAQKRREEAVGVLENNTDPTPDLAAAREKVRSATARNAALEPWREWENSRGSLAAAQEAAAELTGRIDGLRELEATTIAGAGIPVEGLTFDADGHPLLNGRALELASGGERIGMATAVALAVDPQLRVCLVDEANDLDLAALEALAELGERHDFQIFACRIGIEGPGEIVVEDGMARTDEPKRIAAGDAAAGESDEPEDPAEYVSGQGQGADLAENERTLDDGEIAF